MVLTLKTSFFRRVWVVVEADVSHAKGSSVTLIAYTHILYAKTPNAHAAVIVAIARTTPDSNIQQWLLLSFFHVPRLMSLNELIRRVRFSGAADFMFGIVRRLINPNIIYFEMIRKVGAEIFRETTLTIRIATFKAFTVTVLRARFGKSPVT